MGLQRAYYVILYWKRWLSLMSIILTTYMNKYYYVELIINISVVGSDD
jgi:hypothetical protein